MSTHMPGLQSFSRCFASEFTEHVSVPGSQVSLTGHVRKFPVTCTWVLIQEYSVRAIQ